MQEGACDVGRALHQPRRGVDKPIRWVGTCTRDGRKRLHSTLNLRRGGGVLYCPEGALDMYLSARRMPRRMARMLRTRDKASPWPTSDGGDAGRRPRLAHPAARRGGGQQRQRGRERRGGCRRTAGTGREKGSPGYAAPTRDGRGRTPGREKPHRTPCTLPGIGQMLPASG